MTRDNPAAESVLLPPAARTARLIVCERTGRWAVALRRELADRASRVSEVRSLAQAFRALDAAPASFLVAELTGPSAVRLLDLMAELQRWYPLARLAVVSDRKLAGYGPLVREAAAVWFASSPRRLGPLAEAACRHLADAPRPRRGLREQIWASLPWRSGEEPASIHQPERN